MIAEGEVSSILIVDDEPLIRQIFIHELRKRKIPSLSASNANEALDLLQKYSNEISLVVSDVRMPGGDGEILLDKKITPTLIFMTGFMNFNREDFLARGAAAVFDKPLRLQELISDVLKFYTPRILISPAIA